MTPTTAPNGRKRVAVLGSTGSIGQSTLDVLARHPERFEVFALAANRNAEALTAQCLKFAPRFAALADESAARRLADELRRSGCVTRVLAGRSGLRELAIHPEADVVMAAIVGAAGLDSTLAAARAGKRILLANKEALVMSGALFMQTVKSGGATLLPVDSEHNAIFQCLPPQGAAGVKRLLLTASGGPFLRSSAESLFNVTPEQACAHPRWDMGRKISVDSATLMNKGLELIEACLLFGMSPEQVEVVVHPQSIVHSLVEYIDGSVLAQCGNPDMRTPIAYSLGWPERLVAGVESLDLFKVGRLEFEPPDLERFPCLRLARSAAQTGGSAPTVMNAANEVAVAAFLERRIAFPAIAVVIEQVLAQHACSVLTSLDEVMAADAWGRAKAQEQLPFFHRSAQ